MKLYNYIKGINIENFDAEHFVLKNGSIIQSKKILAAKLEF